MQPFMTAEGLTKDFGATRALDDLTLEFLPGEIHALCGHNGAGKSTLVQVLAGIQQPDAGSITIDGREVALHGARDAERWRVAFVQQELSVLPTLSVEENVLLGGPHDSFLSRPHRFRDETRRLLDMVGLSRLDPQASAADLSAGEQQLIEIARGIGRDARLLILDEPTATLSDVEIERVFTVVRRLAAEGAAIVFVSHRLGEVLGLCHRVSVMRDGKLVASLPVRELSRESLVHMMVGPVESTATVHGSSLDPDAGVSVSITDLEVPGRLAPFSLQVRRGEIVALAGQLGAGATEVLRALSGLEPTSSGSLTVGGADIDIRQPRQAIRQGIHYLSNDRKSEGLFLQHSAAMNLLAPRLPSVARGGVVSRDRQRRLTLSLAERVRFATDRLDEPAGQFSGGNQQKLFVGRLMDQPRPGLVLLDEPTRGVDVRGRAEIHDLVRQAAEQGNTVIFASTELEEILDLAHTVVIMRAGHVIDVKPRTDMTSHSILHGITHAEDRRVAA